MFCKLCLIFGTVIVGGTVLSQLLTWLRWHFVEGDQIAREAMRSDRPQDHDKYWDAVSLNSNVC